MTVQELMDILKKAKPTAKIVVCNGIADYDIITGYSTGIVNEFDEINDKCDELYLSIDEVGKWE